MDRFEYDPKSNIWNNAESISIIRAIQFMGTMVAVVNYVSVYKSVETGGGWVAEESTGRCSVS